MLTYLVYFGDALYPSRVGRIDGVRKDFQVGDKLLVDDALLKKFSRPTGAGQTQQFAEFIAGVENSLHPDSWGVTEESEPEEVSSNTADAPTLDTSNVGASTAGMKQKTPDAVAKGSKSKEAQGAPEGTE